MKLTWLGHSAFHLRIEGTDLLIDPFWTGSPTFPAGYEDRLAKVDFILITHAHGDHMGDAARLAGKYQATVVAQFEICEYLGRGGLVKFEPMNTGGAVQVGGCTLAMVQAFHSSTMTEDGVVTCVGDPVGFVVSGGGQTLYHTGDTGLFGDMALIQKIYRPTIGLIPIGDRFTMGPATAAYACNELLDLKTIVPMHWGTFPMLPGTPEAFKALVRRGSVLVPTPGETIEV
jgi:L-ascorbate metabolism protein UlaG (beta-lactamase superfamily)